MVWEGEYLNLTDLLTKGQHEHPKNMSSCNVPVQDHDLYRPRGAQHAL